MPLETESTAVLLTRLRNGEDEAREVLAARYLPILRRWAHGRLPGYARGAVDTDDLVQVCLIKSLDRLDRFESRREGALLAYLRRAILNAIRDEIRRAARRPKIPADETLVDSVPSAVERVIGRERMERYEAALERLEEIPREAVILRLEFGYGPTEIAAAIGSPSPDAARMVVSRALVRLTEMLDDSP